MPDNALCHYASKYYDPVKAHEYYEEHKQLKGRTSTAGLNEDGREAAKYVKSQINTERDSVIENERTAKDSTIEEYASRMNTEIERIREELTRMRAGDRADNTLRVKREIAKLRAENAAKRAEINEQFKATKASVKENYTNKYISELDALKADPTMQSTKSSSSSSGLKSLGLTRDQIQRYAKSTSDKMEKKTK